MDLAPPQQTHFLGGERNTRDRALFDFCAVQELPNLAYVGLVAGAQPHVQYGSGLCVCVCVCVCVYVCVTLLALTTRLTQHRLCATEQ